MLGVGIDIFVLCFKKKHAAWWGRLRFLHQYGHCSILNAPSFLIFAYILALFLAFFYFQGIVMKVIKKDKTFSLSVF